jgi:GNAT superfamily N-acetyltransferase
LVVQAGPLPAPYPNPYHENNPHGAEPEGGPEGHHWYHGTRFDPGDGSDGELKTPEGQSGKHGERADQHWNTDLGVHFTALHGVARNEFATRDGRLGNPLSRVAHASLHMRNPINFTNEDDFAHHAASWAHGEGHRYLPEDGQAHKAFIHANYDHVEEHDAEEGHYRSYGYHDKLGMDSEDRERVSALDLDGPKKHDAATSEHWLGHHPDRARITSGYRQHLQSQGHDGVVYGNTFEGPRGHASAIAFPQTPVSIHKWEFLDPRHPNHEPRTGSRPKDIANYLPHGVDDVRDAPWYRPHLTGNFDGRPIEHLPISSLHRTQDGANTLPGGVGATDAEPVRVIRHQGTNWLYDGHHRVMHAVDHGEKHEGGRFTHDEDRCPTCGGPGELANGSECSACDGSGRATCPCGQQVAYDLADGYQHLDGSISHGGKFWDKSVSDLMKRASAEPTTINYSHFAEGDDHVFDAHHGGKNVGYVTTKQKPDHAWLDELYVHPDYRGHGIARQLMQNALDHHAGTEMRLKAEPYAKDGEQAGQSVDQLQDFYRQYGFQGSGPHMTRSAKRWMPTKRLFGPTNGLDHRLFDGEHLKPEVRAYILDTLNGFWKPMFGDGWKTWARVYFAGSEASEWTSPTLEGNNDFDILIGVDYDKFRASVGGMGNEANETITSALNEQLRIGLDPRTDPTMITIDGQQTGPWSNTWYVNHNSYDIRGIRPYAAYDVTQDEWVVKPPHLPEWDTSKFPEGKGLTKEIQGIVDMAKGILAMPEPFRTQNGKALWEFVHANRSDAFGPQGEGWYDPRNVIEKALDQAGLMQKLWTLMDNARQDPHVLDAPASWSNDPGSVA